MTFYLIACCHSKPISFSRSNMDDIFDKNIINSVDNVIVSSPPSCFHDNVTMTPTGTTKPVSINEPCGENVNQLTCPGNFFEVVYNSSTVPIFLRKVKGLPTIKCENENNVCLGCKQNKTQCKTEFNDMKILVQLDSSLTTIIKRFRPITGKRCRCTKK